MITISDIYLGYVYRGQIKIPKGRVEFDTDLPFPTTQFYEDNTDKRHCRLPRKPYELCYGRVWGRDKEKVREMIVNRYKECIRELEQSNALAYAEMVVGSEEK